MLFLALLSLTASMPALAADGPAEDPKHFTSADMNTMAGRMARSLKKCKELKHGSVKLNFDFKNMTSEFIDKDAFVKAIEAQLVPAAGGPGKAYDLAVKLVSTEASVGDSYDNRYRLEAELKQGEEVFCKKSEKIEKKGKR